MSLYIWLFLIYGFQEITAQYQYVKMDEGDERYELYNMLEKTMEELIINGQVKLESLLKIRQETQNSAPFEIGYITQTIQENYRRMIDNWHSTMTMPYGYLQMELTLYLEEIEHFYWSIEHLCNMLHEVERKYKVKSDLDSDYKEDLDTYFGATNDTNTTFAPPPRDPFAATRKRKFHKFKMNKFLSNHFRITTARTKNKHFPMYYGWEIDEWNSDT